MRKTKHLCSKIPVLTLALFSLPLAALLYTTSASAQSETDTSSPPVLPPGPILAPAPDYSQWVVTFSYQQDKSKGQNSVASPTATPDVETRTRTITTTKTDDIVHEEIISGTGYKVDEWHVKTAQYTQISGSKLWLEPRPDGSNGYLPLPASGFRDLDWLTASDYAGTIKYGGRDCLLFITGAPPKFDTPDPDLLDHLPAYAFIDVESRLPVKVRFNGSTRFYQFKDAPTEKLTLPPDLIDVLKQGEEMRAKASQPPPRPY